jgi:hypothetical protein
MYVTLSASPVAVKIETFNELTSNKARRLSLDEDSPGIPNGCVLSPSRSLPRLRSRTLGRVDSNGWSRKIKVVLGQRNMERKGIIQLMSPCHKFIIKGNQNRNSSKARP